MFIPDPNQKFKLNQGDAKPEIHFFGQIVGGVNFNI